MPAWNEPAPDTFYHTWNASEEPITPRDCSSSPASLVPHPGLISTATPAPSPPGGWSCQRNQPPATRNGRTRTARTPTTAQVRRRRRARSARTRARGRRAGVPPVVLLRRGTDSVADSATGRAESVGESAESVNPRAESLGESAELGRRTRSTACRIGRRIGGVGEPGRRIGRRIGPKEFGGGWARGAAEPRFVVAAVVGRGHPGGSDRRASSHDCRITAAAEASMSSRWARRRRLRRGVASRRLRWAIIVVNRSS